MSRIKPTLVRTTVVREYQWTEEELRERLGFEGRITDVLFVDKDGNNGISLATQEDR